MLKTTFVFAVILSATHLLQAQEINRQFNYDWKLDAVKYKPIEYEPVQHVKEATFTVTNHNKTKVYKKEYNEAGKLTGFYKADKNGVSQPVWKLYYNGDNKLIKAESFKNGALQTTKVYEFNGKGEPLRQEKMNAASEILYKNVWVYDVNGCFKENIRYKKGGVEMKSKLVNEFEADCKVSKMTLYNAKGKVKSIRSYECNREGEQLEKKKNETQVCRWEKLDENILTKSYQTFDEDGKTVKTVIKYLLPDTLMLEWTNYDAKDKIIYRSTYDKDKDKPLLISWYRKGKQLSEVKYEYKDDLLVSKAFIVDGKTINKTVYTYNPDQLLAELKVIDKRDDVTKVAKMEYVR